VRTNLKSRNCNAWRQKGAKKPASATMLAKWESTPVPVKHQWHSTDNDNDRRHPQHIFSPKNSIDRSRNAYTTETEQNEELYSVYWRRSSALELITAEDVRKQ
jgi:hypothetical protein